MLSCQQQHTLRRTDLSHSLDSIEPLGVPRPRMAALRLMLPLLPPLEQRAMGLHSIAASRRSRSRCRRLKEVRMRRTTATASTNHSGSSSAAASSNAERRTERVGERSAAGRPLD